MNIIKDKNFNTFVDEDDDRIFLLPENTDKPIVFYYENPNRKIEENDDGSFSIVEKVSLEWVLNHISDEDKKRIINAIENSYGRKIILNNVLFYR